VPLRVRLVAAVLLLASLALAVSAVLTTSVLRGYLLDQTDSDLRTSAEASEALARAVDAVPSCRALERPVFQRRDPGPGGPGSPDLTRRYYTLVEGPSGRRCELAGPRQGSPDTSDLDDEGTSTVGSAEGRGQWRVAVESVDGGGRVIVATPLGADVDDTVDRLLLIQGLVSLAVLVVVLNTVSAHDVRDDMRYVLLYFFLGAMWVSVVVRILPFGGLSARDDVVIGEPRLFELLEQQAIALIEVESEPFIECVDDL